MQQFVFVSHASKDKIERPAALRRLLDALTDSNIKVWIDNPARLGYTPEDIERRFLRLKAGIAYEQEIDEARNQAGVVLGVWSRNVTAAFAPTAAESGRILRGELTKAREKKTLVCCRIDDVPPTTYPDAFDREQVADVRTEGEHHVSELAGLVSDIKTKLRTPFFHMYRESRIAEWSRPRYGASDKLFTELALLLDRGADRDERWDEQKEHYSSLKALLDKNSGHMAFVLLGAPGSGKSTLLRHFDLEVARRAQALAPADKSFAPFSYFVSLKEYRDADGGSPNSPLEWLRERWNTEWRKTDLHVQTLDELLQAPDSFLLLDALNEMPRGAGKDYGQLVADWKAFIADARARKWRCRIVFSCRSLLYSNQLSSAGESMVPHIDILPLDAPTIRDFLLHYAGAERGPALFARIDDQLALYNTAFFLRMLVDVSDRSGQAPRDRAALFTAFVRMLMAREFRAGNEAILSAGPLHAHDIKRLDTLAFSDDGWRTAYELLERGPLFRQLSQLAYSMQSSGVGAQTEEHLQLVVDYDKALMSLAPTPGDEEAARAILLTACEISVLEHEPGKDQVQFVHQLIQEYFAGRQLAVEPQTALVKVGWKSTDVGERTPENINEPLPQADSTGWEETTLFAVLMTKDREKFIKQLREVNLPLAGRAAAQVRASEHQDRSGGANDASSLSEGLVNALREKLVDRMTDRRGALRSRIAAGKALGDLGDARFKQHDGAMTPPTLRIERGTHYIGQDDSPHTHERPRSPVALNAFQIAQFPVTNAEYQLFIRANGYQDERWWRTKASKLWWSGETTHAARTVQWYAFRNMVRETDYVERKLRDKDISERIAEDHLKARDQSNAEFAATMRADFAGGRHHEPRRWRDRNFNNALQPVVGVSWYEANAYCAWLSAQTGETWRLPTEAEWEAAARLYAARNAVYPWGPSFDPTRCNTFRSHVRATTPVGLYVGSGNALGLFRKKPALELADMSGNAFEWTSSCYDKQRYRYPYRADDGRESPEDSPGRDDATSRVMANDLENRAREENWSPEKLAQAIEVACYFPRVLRGGSFYYWPDEARMSFRLRFHPGYHNQSTGFRLVREG